MASPWADDKLGFDAVGDSFTKLIQSIAEAKVLSIEAGFGRGKTFFRKAWAQHLRDEGEVVVELDALLADHTGDPVVTLLASMVDHAAGEKTKYKNVLGKVGKLGKAVAVTGLHAALRGGAEVLTDAASDIASGAFEDQEVLKEAVEKTGESLSKAAAQMITAQLAAEKVRKELPEQLDGLRQTLTKGKASDRIVVIVVIVDELDRCHPDYTIAFLEAMKLVFNQPGFVFCLMINPNYLENLAAHRFGKTKDNELYLDKFVDIRLKLPRSDDRTKGAVEELFSDLPLAISFAYHEAFSVASAAELAGRLAVKTGVSMRKCERIKLRVETALRCHSDTPLDVALLVFLAFRDVKSDGAIPSTDDFPRSFLTPEEGQKQMDLLKQVFRREADFADTPSEARRKQAAFDKAATENTPEFEHLPKEMFVAPNGSRYYTDHVVFALVAPSYIPDHRAVLDHAASLLVAEARQ